MRAKAIHQPLRRPATLAAPAAIERPRQRVNAPALCIAHAVVYSIVWFFTAAGPLTVSHDALAGVQLILAPYLVAAEIISISVPVTSLQASALQLACGYLTTLTMWLCMTKTHTKN